MKNSKNILSSILSVYMIIIYIFSISVHIYTTYAAYESYGLFWGIIAFFCPVISTITMFILYLVFYGISCQFCIIMLIYLFSIIMMYFLGYITDKKENNPNKKLFKIKPKTVMIVSICLLVVLLIFLVSYLLYDYISALKMEASHYKSLYETTVKQYNKLDKKYTDLLNDYVQK